MLPDGWAEATIGEVADTKLGKMLDAAKNKGEPVPYLRNVNVRWGTFDLDDLFEMKVTTAEREELSVRDGDLFMCEGGEPGRCAVWRGGDRDLVFQKAIHRVRPLGGVEPDYLARYMGHVAADEGFSHLLTGTTIKHLPQVALQRIALPLPPAAEQRRLVAKLDALTARLARARAELDRVPVLAGKLRSEALGAAFAHGADTSSIASLTDFVTSGSRGWAKYYADDGPAFVRVGDVRRGGIQLDLANLQRVRPPQGAEGIRTAARPGDVVVTITADLGRVGVVGDDLGPAFVNQHVALLRPKTPALASWIGWYLTSREGQRQMLAKDRGVTKAGLGLDDIRQVSVPMPDASERADRLTILEATFARADRLEAEAARARALLGRMEAAILARAFRGELVPQDPADEPASVLLDRIRAARAAAPKARRSRRAREGA